LAGQKPMAGCLLLKSEYYNPSIQPEYTTQQSMKYLQHY
jgi:hypothetical protein